MTPEKRSQKVVSFADRARVLGNGTDLTWLEQEIAIEIRAAEIDIFELAAQVAETYESKHTLSTEMLRFDRNPTTLADGITQAIRALKNNPQ